MQRIEGEYLIVSCDFCATDWDGSSPVIEGHRGAIICLECLKQSLDGLSAGQGAFSCPLCLRDKIPAEMPRWSHTNRPGTFACERCIQQAADVFDRDPDVPWQWSGRPKSAIE